MAENTLDVRLLHAAKTLDDWNNVTTIPKLGEVCLEIQGNTPPLNYKIKIGDGSSTYAALPYFGTVVNTSGNASVVVVDTITDGSVTRKVLKFYKFTLTTSTVNGVTTITPTIGDLILTVQEGDGINFSTNTTDTLVNVELEATTADTAQTIADGGTFTTITKDSNDRATKYTTFTLPSITSKINALDVADNTVITAEWDSTNKQIKLYYVKETDGIIQKGSLAYTINATDIAPLQNITTTDTGDSGLDITTNNNVKDVHHKAVKQYIIDHSNPAEEKELDIITNVNVDSYGHITGYTKDKSTNLVAADIKAPVRQSDNSMWNHRVTGGTINIGEETAKISKLRGNTVVWNQLVENGNFANDTTGWTASSGTISVNSNTLIWNNSATALFQAKFFITTHKYYISAFVKCQSEFSFGAGGSSNIRIFPSSPSSFNRVSNIISPTTEDNTIYFYPNDNTEMQFRSVIMVDLTKMFGAGNEPTVEEFEAMFPNSYYPYNEGELLSLKPTGVKSIGFNLWDEEWEVGAYNSIDGSKATSASLFRCKNLIPVFPSTIYYFRGSSSIWVFAYGKNGNYLGLLDYANVNSTFTTPANCGFLTFHVLGTSYSNDICINISDSSRNGTYEPYKESILDLSWIKSIKDSEGNQLFPYGLLSAGSVHDEVGDNYAIKRVGSVDLGSLNWAYEFNNTQFYVGLLSGKAGPVGNFNVNVVCGKYITNSLNYGLLSSAHVRGIHNNGALYLIDDQYSDAATFKTAMQGVMLYYELAEPVTVYFDKKPMTYPVDDLGTETLLPEGVDSTTGVPLSAPFNGTFEYKSNFKDTVLDLIDKVNNARNPVKGVINTNQTVDKLAIYDSTETVKSSNYSPSNATIVEGATGNDIILPAVETIVNYVNSKLSSALTYKGTVATETELHSKESQSVTGDLYIANDTIIVNNDPELTTLPNGTYYPGTFFIWNDTKWDVIPSTTTVVNRDLTLAFNTQEQQTIGTVDGQPLTIRTPNLNYPSSPISSVGQSIDFIDTVSQTNGLVNATKKAIPSARTIVNGTNYDILVPLSASLWSSIYAPTTAGTNGQFLKSTAGTPIWATLGIGDLGLYSKNLKQNFNGQDTNLGNIIRNSNEDLNLPAFYAPLDAGTSYNLLMSNGSGAPSWTTFLSADNGYLKKTANGGWSLDPYGGSSLKPSYANNTAVTASEDRTPQPSAPNAGLREQTGANTYKHYKIPFSAIENDPSTGNDAVTIILNGNFS